MQEWLQNTEHEAYSKVYMKKKLQNHFGKRIIITEINGKQDVVTFRDTASSILVGFHKQSKNDSPELEKKRIIETAAKLIHSDVKFQETKRGVYSSPADISSTSVALDFIPDTLKLLLMNMFVGINVDVKVASIGQAIMQAVRPRVLLAPLQLGLGVQLHRHFASRFLIDTLHSQGFCCSFFEVKRYERRAAISQEAEFPDCTGGENIQYVANNIDHNTATLDGSGTFHGMGIVAAKTPATGHCKPVPRACVTAEDIAAVGRVNIEYFKASCDLEPLVYQPIVDLKTQDPTLNLDVLWETSLLLRCPRPSWSGMMQMVNKGNHPGKASVMFLPMIDMNPSDPSCVYSTLRFVCAHAKRYDVTPVLTFDQPLWWKALTIIRSQPADSDLKKVVLRLGGLHTETSFLGSIGHLMTGSGLRELLEVVYASNTVGHMMSGKAISRAVRGHFLVAAALNTMIVSYLYNVQLPTNEEEKLSEERLSTNEEEKLSEVQLSINEEELLSEVQLSHMETGTEYQQVASETDLAEAQKLYDSLLSGTVSVNDVCASDVMKQILARMKTKKESMQNRTAILWVQYMEMIDILRMFIKAERTGNWDLHLQAIHDMLPFFAASGHILYTKSAYIYLQMMCELPQTHPDVYRRFQEGHHVVRRSDRYWAGLSTDLIIEQVLMRSLKTSGGLTRGTGFSETQRNVWLLSMPSCAEMNDAMQNFTGVKYETSDQHKDLSKLRQKRDVNDTLLLLDYLEERSPFSQDSTLHNIANVITPETTVNVDQSKIVGKKILDSLVDPQLLFQRLVAVSRERTDELPLVFSHELCSYPPALFESSYIPLKANKAAIADALWKLLGNEQQHLSSDVHFILDGGALLHRLPWPRGIPYDHIRQLYVDYVIRKYGKATVVFDGYEDGPTTKDVTHLRRTGACPGLTVNFAGDMVIKSKKEEFLANEVNKQRFINLLSKRLERAGCVTIHARNDADVLIVTTAVESARVIDTILVGDDTDLLVLLIFYAE
nr:uncharacterized protein LOC129274841 [Lytechinus pictus]